MKPQFFSDFLLTILVFFNHDDARSLTFKGNPLISPPTTECLQFHVCIIAFSVGQKYKKLPQTMSHESVLARCEDETTSFLRVKDKEYAPSKV